MYKFIFLSMLVLFGCRTVSSGLKAQSALEDIRDVTSLFQNYQVLNVDQTPQNLIVGYTINKDDDKSYENIPLIISASQDATRSTLKRIKKAAGSNVKFIFNFSPDYNQKSSSINSFNITKKPSASQKSVYEVEVVISAQHVESNQQMDRARSVFRQQLRLVNSVLDTIEANNRHLSYSVIGGVSHSPNDNSATNIVIDTNVEFIAGNMIQLSRYAAKVGKDIRVLKQNHQHDQYNSSILDTDEEYTTYFFIDPELKVKLTKLLNSN